MTQSNIHLIHMFTMIRHFFLHTIVHTRVSKTRSLNLKSLKSGYMGYFINITRQADYINTIRGTDHLT